MHDPRYVKFFVFAYEMKNGKEIDNPIMYHECSEEELRVFKNPSNAAKFDIDEAILEKKNFFCLDWKGDRDKLSIWGSWYNPNYRFISIMLAPCNYVPKGFEDVYPVSDECV